MLSSLNLSHISTSWSISQDSICFIRLPHRTHILRDIVYLSLINDRHFRCNLYGFPYRLVTCEHKLYNHSQGLTSSHMYTQNETNTQWRGYGDDVIKWNHIPRYWPLVRGIHRWPVNSPHKGQWRGALMFSLIYAWINVWVNDREAGDLWRHRAHYDVTVMSPKHIKKTPHSSPLSPGHTELHV